MKIVKLLIFAIIIGGIVYGITKLDTIFGKKDVDEGIRLEDIELLKPFIAEYEEEWANAPAWDADLLDSHHSTAARLRNSRDISSAAYDKLVRNINNDALARLEVLLTRDFKLSEVPESKVAHNMEGIKTLKGNVTDENTVKKMEDVYNTFNRTKAFVNKKYYGTSFSNGLTSTCESWTSFDSHLQSELRKRDDLKNAPLFKEFFANNTMLNSGLNTTSERVETARNDYYRLLHDRIVEQYRNVPSFNSEYNSYRDRYYNSSTDSEAKSIRDEYDAAWDNYINTYANKMGSIRRINNKFSQEYPNASFNRIPGIASEYKSQSKPAL